MHEPETVAALMRTRGMKVTPQRAAIVGILHRRGGHVTAEAVYQEARLAMPTISLKTVYETLHSLVDLGVLQPIDLGTGSMLFDPTVHPHHHLVCTSCGMTRDVVVEVETPDDERSQGFVVHRADVVLRGLCASCAVA